MLLQYHHEQYRYRALCRGAEYATSFLSRCAGRDKQWPQIHALGLVYIFPQLRGLGYSHNAHYYGISGREEARRYLQHPVLGGRLREISHALLQHKGMEAESILGGIDAMKVRSCMTLFDAISPNDVFAEVLNTFYAGSRCESTLALLANTPA